MEELHSRPSLPVHHGGFQRIRCHNDKPIDFQGLTGSLGGEKLHFRKKSEAAKSATWIFSEKGKDRQLFSDLEPFAIGLKVAQRDPSMFFKKKFDPSPRGVPLEGLENALRATTLKISRDADSLTAKHEAAVTKLKVIPPVEDEASKDRLQAIVQITTDLPANLPRSFFTAESLMTLNQAAVLGALTVVNGRCFIGSRLTVFEQEQAWNLYFPFLLFTVVSGIEHHVGAILSMLGSSEGRSGDSAWTADDFSYVQSKLSEICVCAGGGRGLTAEFGLRPGMVSAASGHHMTALWQLKAEEPHPGAGAGLLCTLHMPHRVPRERIADILQDLNRREMAPRDQPPHFGAWCQGNSENTLAYVSFLPNVMHRTAGIALNLSIWALHRAHWADAYLASIGVHL